MNVLNEESFGEHMKSYLYKILHYKEVTLQRNERMSSGKFLFILKCKLPAPLPARACRLTTTRRVSRGAASCLRPPASCRLRVGSQSAPSPQTADVTSDAATRG